MNNIFILDGQTDEVLGHINKKYVIDNEHEKDLPTHKDYFRFTVLAENKHAEHLNKRNGLIIQGEDGELLEFRIFESIKYRNNEGLFIEVHALATYLDLKNQKIFDPHKTNSETALQHANLALAGTEWQIGQVDFKGIRTLTFDNPFNSYDYILRISREFELEPNFYIETDGNKVTGRYVDLVEQIGEFRGRTIEFGRDLQSIERKEDTSEVVTALWIYGPQREDGTRLKVFVEDDEARQRWGRRGQHIIDYYEPQTENQDITEERLKTLGEMELKKRINAVVTYEADIVDLENVPGMENKKIRFGDTIRIKDTKFSPPLYVEARVFNVKRDVFNKAKKTVQLGDYREYTEEEVKALFRQMQAEIRRRLERLVLVSIISSAGNVFKNGVGSTELTAKTFLSGNEVDVDGTKYVYRWHKFDKNGDYVPGFYEEGKTISVSANTIDEKASFRVEIILDDEVLTVHEITLTNVFDGEDGEPGPPGPKGEDGKTFYTWIKYADTPTSGMSDNPEGKEYIGIAYNKETPTPSTNYADYVWSKFKGEQGVPGPPGEDGQPTYTWVKYADDEHGNGMSDSPDGKLYIGLAFNKTTPEESNNPADYTWSLMPQNIEIGGRNYIRNLYSGEWFKFSSNLNVDIISETRVRIYGDSGSANHRYAIVVPLEPNTEYTIAANFIESDNSYFLFREKNNTEKDRSGQINIHTPDQRTPGNYTVGEGEIVYTFTTTENTKSIIIEIGSSGDGAFDVTFEDMRLQKGNKATDWTPAPEDVQEQIDEAKQEAEEAKQEAQQAQTTADGKNSVFTQSTAPPTDGRKIGDVWFDTSRDNLMHRFDGTQWVEAKWGEQSIVANSITANHIKSLVGLNVNDQFIVDSQGNVKFAGNLEGASGTFAGNLEGASGTFSGRVEGAVIEGSEFISNDEDGGGIIRISDGVIETATTVDFTHGAVLERDQLRIHATNAVGETEFSSTLTNNSLRIQQAFNASVATYSATGVYSKNENGVLTLHTDQVGNFNGDVSVNADGGDLYLGYSNTGAVRTSIDIIAKDYYASGGKFESTANHAIIRANASSSRIYLQARHEVRATLPNTADNYIPVRASGHVTGSKAEYKEDIKVWEDNALPIIKQSVIHEYRLKNNPEKLRYGLVIGEGYATPEEIIDGDGVDQYIMNSLSWKAIQELDDKYSNIENRLSKIEELMM